MLLKGATHNLMVRTRAEVALYALNQKRAHLRALEERFRITITVSADPTVSGQQSFVIDRGEQVHTPEAAKAIAAMQPEPSAPVEDESDDLVEDEVEAADEAEAETTHDAEPMDIVEVPAYAEPATDRPPTNGHRHENGERAGGRRRRRRGRGRGRSGEPREQAPFTHDTVPEHTVAHEDHNGGGGEDASLAAEPREAGSAAPQAGESAEHREGRRRRRRGRRGGRRNRQGREGEAPFAGENDIGINDPAAPETNLRRAVEDLDRPPAPFADEREPFDQPAATFDRPAAPPATAHTPDAEPPRRRSTIREPAPVGASTSSPPPAAIPPPTPVISSTATGDAGTPKRGWWAKRLLGDK